VTEQELRRTAVIIPPTGRAVLCVWAAVPGLFAAPFVFWQSPPERVSACSGAFWSTASGAGERDSQL